MGEIRTKRGDVILVDDEDVAFLSTMRWRLIGKGYAVTTERGVPAASRRHIYMHRLLMGLDAGRDPQVDHRNGNRSDNRKANLRPGSPSQNNANARMRSHNTGGLKGAYKLRPTPTSRWFGQIRMNGRQYYLGAFDTAEEAHRAYCEAAKGLHGEFFNPG